MEFFLDVRARTEFEPLEIRYEIGVFGSVGRCAGLLLGSVDLCCFIDT